MQKINFMKLIMFFLAGALWPGCSSINENFGIPILDKAPDLGITSVPDTFEDKYRLSFDRYTEVIAPNGKPISIFAQNRITNDQIIRARNILEHYLTNFTGSLFGENKGRIADRMADNKAKLLLLNGRDDGSNSPALDGQPLYEEELPVEGDSWYIDNLYEEHRDAAFEEILHLVHDYGIGVDGRFTTPGALPEFQNVIRKAQINALDRGIWGIGAQNWINELTRENSLSQEYLASVIDSYYGLWGAWLESSVPESQETGMYGLYSAKTREELEIEDPEGWNVIRLFFHPFLTYNARIAPQFSGIFSLSYQRDLPYTHKSQYLKSITLTGSHNSGIRINSLDNDITGNSGSNTVFFSGKSTEYEIITDKDKIIIRDNYKDRDGTNTLRMIEVLSFLDAEIVL